MLPSRQSEPLVTMGHNPNNNYGTAPRMTLEELEAAFSAPGAADFPFPGLGGRTNNGNGDVSTAVTVDAATPLPAVSALDTVTGTGRGASVATHTTNTTSPTPTTASISTAVERKAVLSKTLSLSPESLPSTHSLDKELAEIHTNAAIWEAKCRVVIKAKTVPSATEISELLAEHSRLALQLDQFRMKVRRLEANNLLPPSNRSLYGSSIHKLLHMCTKVEEHLLRRLGGDFTQSLEFAQEQKVAEEHREEVLSYADMAAAAAAEAAGATADETEEDHAQDEEEEGDEAEGEGEEEEEEEILIDNASPSRREEGAAPPDTVPLSGVVDAVAEWEFEIKRFGSRPKGQALFHTKNTVSDGVVVRKPKRPKPSSTAAAAVIPPKVEEEKAIHNDPTVQSAHALFDTWVHSGHHHHDRKHHATALLGAMKKGVPLAGRSSSPPQIPWEGANVTKEVDHLLDALRDQEDEKQQQKSKASSDAQHAWSVLYDDETQATGIHNTPPSSKGLKYHRTPNERHFGGMEAHEEAPVDEERRTQEEERSSSAAMAAARAAEAVATAEEREAVAKEMLQALPQWVEDALLQYLRRHPPQQPFKERKKDLIPSESSGPPPQESVEEHQESEKHEASEAEGTNQEGASRSHSSRPHTGTATPAIEKDEEVEEEEKAPTDDDDRQHQEEETEELQETQEDEAGEQEAEEEALNVEEEEVQSPAPEEEEEEQEEEAIEPPSPVVDEDDDSNVSPPPAVEEEEEASADNASDQDHAGDELGEGEESESQEPAVEEKAEEDHASATDASDKDHDDDEHEGADEDSGDAAPAVEDETESYEQQQQQQEEEEPDQQEEAPDQQEEEAEQQEEADEEEEEKERSDDGQHIEEAEAAAPPTPPPAEPEEDPAVTAALESGEWVSMFDLNSGETYFYKPSTEEMSWDLKATLAAAENPSADEPVAVDASTSKDDEDNVSAGKDHQEEENERQQSEEPEPEPASSHHHHDHHDEVAQAKDGEDDKKEIDFEDI